MRHVNDGNWHHIAFVRVGASLTTYIDGTQDVTGSGTGVAYLSNTAALNIGYLPVYSYTHYVGTLDETRIYNRALSAAEVLSLAQNTPVPSTANQLQSYWKYSEGSGTVAYDSCHSVVNTYDVDDRLLTTINGRGDTVTYAYDGTDPVSGAAQKGLLSSKTDGNGHVTRYRYTARNEPWATLYADGTAESVAYDENGNTTSRTKADGSVIAYTYDADNRLTDITYPHMAATHFDYDADGRKTHMHDSTGDTYWTYGDGVNLTQVTSPQGTVTYAYDSDGRRTTLTATGIGSWITTFDPGGRVTSTKNPYNETTTLSYDAANRLTKKTKGNLNYELYAYDVADEMTSIGYWWAGGIEDRSLIYSYDPAGNVLSRNEGNRLINYGYDGADQQTAEVTTGAVPITIGYTYDSNGNRLTQTQNGSPYQSFTYDAHDKLTSGTAGNETDAYDANGNETSVSISGGLYSMTYDDEDRLTHMTSSGGLNDTFIYNGLGLRVGKIDSTGTYSYLCDGATPGSSVISDGAAVYTPGESERRAGASSFPDFDSLGNILTIDAASGDVTQAGYLVTGFGTPEYTSGSSPTPFKYGGANGCQTDNDTGLILMGYRYYDTRIGRFISQDPAGDGDNWYAYCDNSPVNGADPSGLSIVDLPTAEAQAHNEIARFEEDIPAGRFLTDGYEIDTYQRTRETIGIAWVSEPTADDPDHGHFDDVWGPWSPWVLQSSVPLGNGISCLYSTPHSDQESLWDYLKRLFRSGGLVDNHNMVTPTLGAKIPSRGVGPSGKPKIHNPKFPSKKEAFESAKRASKGGQDPVHHANPTIGDPHYHPVDESGNILKNGVHYNY